MSRQTLALIFLSVVLMVAVVAFSFLLLIPEGKKYRMLRLESKQEAQKLEAARQKHDEIHTRLKELESQHRPVIKAFDNPFNPDRFTRLYKKEFDDLYLTEVTTFDSNGTFRTYEVNATSKITSPQNFYTFLENINQSGWVIGVNFPIHFERDGERIRSSFTMRVYNQEAPKE